jgi:hypothetical protein
MCIVQGHHLDVTEQGNEPALSGSGAVPNDSLFTGRKSICSCAEFSVKTVGLRRIETSATSMGAGSEADADLECSQAGSIEGSHSSHRSLPSMPSMPNEGNPTGNGTSIKPAFPSVVRTPVTAPCPGKNGRISDTSVFHSLYERAYT